MKEPQPIGWGFSRLYVYQHLWLTTCVVILPAAVCRTIGLQLCPTFDPWLIVALKPPTSLLSGLVRRVAPLTGDRAQEALTACELAHTAPSLPLERMMSLVD